MSTSGADAVLLDHPICHFSKKFNRHQVQYNTKEKEALSLLLALQHFEVLVSSLSPVVVYTDYNPLVFLARMRNGNQRLMRWSVSLQDFNLEIKHKKDALSCMSS